MLGLQTNTDKTAKRKAPKKTKRPTRSTKSEKLKPFHSYSDATGTTYLYPNGSIIKEYSEADGSKKSMLIRKAN